jgi:hypothetical protein
MLTAMAIDPARAAAGRILAQLMDYRGETIGSLGNRGHGISMRTISRILAGDDKVTESKYLPLDSMLRLPVGTMLRLVAQDPDGIRALPWRDEDVYVREFILSEMAQGEQDRATRRTG